MEGALVNIDDIIMLTEGITSCNDLYQRLDLPAHDTKAEDMVVLAESFNRMIERLQESFEEETQFVAEVSHELRTFIAVILSQCEFAVDGDAKDMEEALQIIYKQSKSMSKMISGFLELSKNTSRRQQFIRERINLSELLYFVTEEMEIPAKKKEIHIEGNIQADIFIEGDETRLLRIFLNLISNAIRYGRKGGVVYVKLWQDGQYIYGTVEDDGIGIPEQELPNIWKRFYQVNPLAKGEGSVGLGLAMVKEDIRMHQGSIRVESKLGVGTCFQIRLPAGC